MGSAQCRGHLLDDGAGTGSGQRPLALKDVAEHAPVNELHHDAVAAIFGLVNVVDADGIGMLQTAGHKGFAQEAPDEILALSQRRVHHLQRAHFVEEQVERLVHVPHPALTHLGENAILVADG